VKTITLIPTPSGWVARYSGDHTDVLDILELFGTDTLPLPFTPNASPQMVLADVVGREPDAVVTLGTLLTGE
jgi:hypothetical protein